MDYNFHTHTWRCSHATGTEEEYILRAIENGIRYMGFSDHIPFRDVDGYEAPKTRVPMADAQTYVQELRALRKKYKDHLELLIGFESEYFPSEFQTMVENARSWGAEYLILGQHYVVPEGQGGKHTNTPTDDANALEAYADSLVAAMQTGIFTYVAHPDVFRFTGDIEVYQEIMRRVCIAAREFSVPLEINFYGIRDKRHYPNVAFWQIAGEEGSPVTFGFDAHDVSSAYDGASLAKARELVKKYHLNYIGAPPLIQI
ncbi:MAG: histidinol-phosphatase [Clostridia bacterium]|nr:histidinol-phosphatase [Clostridia bacterium]